MFEGLSSSKFIITDDFCSALYLAAWSAIPDGEKFSALGSDYDANLGETFLNSKLS
jgi:hypothetical protein